MAPKRKASEAVDESKSKKQTIPAGKKDSLKGLKLLFSGTFELGDRKTCEATAKKYGAKVMASNKLEETDMIVLGTRAGQKKIDEINDKGLRTVSEEEFMEMLKSGDEAKEPEDDDVGDEDVAADDDEEEDQPAAKKPKAAPKKATKKDAPKAAAKNDKKTTIPEGKADSLNGLSLLFTGTFEIDRKTCEATAIEYGGQLVKKLEDADYIVLGTKPGPKKVQQIEEEGLTTISESQFFHLLKTGEAPSDD